MPAPITLVKTALGLLSVTELPNDNLKGLNASKEVTEARRGLGVKHSDPFEKENPPTCQDSTTRGQNPNDGKTCMMKCG